LQVMLCCITGWRYGFRDGETEKIVFYFLKLNIIALLVKDD